MGIIAWIAFIIISFVIICSTTWFGKEVYPGKERNGKFMGIVMGVFMSIIVLICALRY